jgi:hypothetical protein
MLNRQLARAITRRAALAPRQLSSAGNSWVPSGDELLQKVTIQSLVHEISLQQMESVQQVVPWFLKSMPAAYFRQVPDAVQRSHLKAVASVRGLQQEDLSLRIEQKGNDGHSDVTLINTKTIPGQLLSQVRVSPTICQLLTSYLS